MRPLHRPSANGERAYAAAVIAAVLLLLLAGAVQAAPPSGWPQSMEISITAANYAGQYAATWDDGISGYPINPEQAPGQPFGEVRGDGSYSMYVGGFPSDETFAVGSVAWDGSAFSFQSTDSAGELSGFGFTGSSGYQFPSGGGEGGEGEGGGGPDVPEPSGVAALLLLPFLMLCGRSSRNGCSRA